MAEVGEKTGSLNAVARQRFLEVLAGTGNVARAARETGVEARACYRLRQRDAGFAAAWAAALDEGYARLEALLLAAAMGCGEEEALDRKLALDVLARRTAQAKGVKATGTRQVPIEEVEATLIHNAASRWSKALLDNAARPSGALVYDPGDGSTLSPDQYDRLRGEMDAFAGAGNAGRPMLLEGGLKWQAMSLSPADMDFAGTKAAAAREIALAFGVPPMLLGLAGDSTHANYAEANRALWRLAVLPLAALVLEGLAQGLAGWFDAARLGVDLDRVPALAEDRERMWRSVAAADFLTGDEKRALLGLGLGLGLAPGGAA